jgi:hypothetical protein
MAEVFPTYTMKAYMESGYVHGEWVRTWRVGTYMESGYVYGEWVRSSSDS